MNLYEERVTGNARVVVDESTCIVIEQDRLNAPTERFTVGDVDRLCEALQTARAIAQHHQ